MSKGALVIINFLESLKYSQLYKNKGKYTIPRMKKSTRDSVVVRLRKIYDKKGSLK